MARRLMLPCVLLLAICSSALLPACATDEDASAAGDATGGVTSKRIVAAAGGLITDPSGMTSLVIPPGALAQDTDVTLTILPQAGASVVAVSELGPDGLTFLQPVTLTIKGDAALAPAGKSLAVAVKEAGGFVALAGSTYADGAASAPIMHFSQYGLIPVDGDPGGVDGGGSDAASSDGGGSDDSAGGSDAGSTDAGITDAGIVDAGIVDAGIVDAGVVDAGEEDTGGMDAGGVDTGGGSVGCDPAGSLPAPAPGKATMVATFSDASPDFNGTLEPFTGAEEVGIADDAGQSRWLSFNKQQAPNDPTVRQITVAIESMPTACVPYTPVSSPSTLPYVQYFEGANLTKQWWCGGVVIVDTIDGPSYTFHFELVCAPSPVLDAAGTVTMTGKGAGTFM